MATNDPEYQRQYHAKHYAANKQRYIDQAAVRRAKLRAEVDRIKCQPCMDCGGDFNPWQMDFDHRPGEIKVTEIPRLIDRYNKIALYAEIAKCDLVCANCHRDRTHQRQHAEVTQ